MVHLYTPPSPLQERNIVENLMEQEPGVGGVGASGACTSTGGGETSNAGPSNASGDADSMDEGINYCICMVTGGGEGRAGDPTRGV